MDRRKRQRGRLFYQGRMLSLTHPILREHVSTYASTWRIPPQVFISRKLTSEPFQERREEERSINGARNIRPALRHSGFSGSRRFIRIRLDQRRIDARGSRFIYSKANK